MSNTRRPKKSTHSYRGRYAPELHPNAVDKVNKILKRCKGRRNSRKNISHSLTAYGIVLPTDSRSIGLIDQRNQYLEQLLRIEKVFADTVLAMLLYQAVTNILFAKIDELNTRAWNGEKDAGVERNTLPMLSMVQSLLYSAPHKSQLFCALTSPKFASDLAKLGNSPIAKERFSVNNTLRVFQFVLDGVDKKKSRTFFLAALNVIEGRLSIQSRKDYSERYDDLLKISEILVYALPAKDTTKFRRKYSLKLIKEPRDPRPIRKGRNEVRALPNLEQEGRSGLFVKIVKQNSTLICLATLFVVFMVHLIFF
jgi:hypothetical protein